MTQENLFKERVKLNTPLQVLSVVNQTAKADVVGKKKSNLARQRAFVDLPICFVQDRSKICRREVKDSQKAVTVCLFRLQG